MGRTHGHRGTERPRIPCMCGISIAGQPLTQFLLLNGPKGAISHFCMSRALQSLRRTKPKMWSPALSTLVDVPISFPGPTNAPWALCMSDWIVHSTIYCICADSCND